MSGLMNCADTHNAISLPALESGLSLFVEPDGQMTFLYGPAVARASLSARQAKALGLLTSATSGQPGTGSFESVTLQESLANSLRKRLDTAGLILSEATWKNVATPSGRSVSALTRAVNRSSASGSTLLPSISAREHKDSSRAEVLARLDRGDGVAKRICALSPILRYSQEIVGLNPSFAAWIMAIPKEWVLCMPSETPSMLRQQRNSSPPIWNQ